MWMQDGMELGDEIQEAQNPISDGEQGEGGPKERGKLVSHQHRQCQCQCPRPFPFYFPIIHPCLPDLP